MVTYGSLDVRCSDNNSIPRSQGARKSVTTINQIINVINICSFNTAGWFQILYGGDDVWVDRAYKVIIITLRMIPLLSGEMQIQTANTKISNIKTNSPVHHKLKLIFLSLCELHLLSQIKQEFWHLFLKEIGTLFFVTPEIFSLLPDFTYNT